MTDEMRHLRQVASLHPEMIVGSSTAPQTLAKFKAAGFALKFDGDLDLEQAAATGAALAQNDTQGFKDWLSTITAADRPRVYAQAYVGNPPKIEELPPQHYLSGSVPVDRYSANPGADFYRGQLPGAEFAYQPPTMFGSGDLPLVTGSGVDPAILRWAPWYLRHSGAYTESRAHLLAIVEEGLDGDPDTERLQTESGRGNLQQYLAKIGVWVTTPAPSTEPTTEELAQLWPDGRGPS